MSLRRKKKNWLVGVLILAAVGMFFFGYALVPLYNVLCNVIGLNGKTDPSSVKNTEIVDASRTITVQFIANTNSNLPWEFYPITKKIDLHPGQNIQVAYYAKNLSNREMTVQAVPSVSPGLAASHLKKTECFCFRQQTLKPNQSMEMPIIFHLDNTLPKNIQELTLSYTLFEAKYKINKIPGRIN